MAGQDEHLHETGGKIGQLSEASPKHRCAAREANSTEAAQDDPEADDLPLAKQTKPSIIETPELPQRKTVPVCSTITGAQFVCICHWLSSKNYLQDSFLTLAHFKTDARLLSHTAPDNAGPLSRKEQPAHAIETFLLPCKSIYC